MPPELYKRLKIVAAERNMTLRKLVIETLWQKYGVENIDKGENVMIGNERGG